MKHAATMPIRVMMHEHSKHSHAITVLNELTNQLTAPADAYNSWKQLYSDLQIFIDDLNDHMNLENEILFARALQSTN